MAALAGTVPRRQGSSKARDAWVAALVFLPPALLVFTLFVAIPMVQAGWYSAFDWNGFGAPTHFVGWDNFKLLFANRAFKIGVVNNLLIIASSLLVQVPLALGLAVLLSERLRGTNLFRLIFFLPYILAEIAAGLIWRFVYDGEYGLIPKIWGLFGADPPYVLADPHIAVYAILLVIIWKYFGFHMILYIAGLQQIDPTLYEAAHIDGASRWQAFYRITLPLMAPTIRLSVFFMILGSIQLFDVIMPLTKGGPSDSTQTMVTFMYNYGVTRTDIGFGSAVGVILFLVCASFAVFYRRVVMRND